MLVSGSSLIGSWVVQMQRETVPAATFDYGDWPLAERLALKIAEIYDATVGNLQQVLGDINLSCSPAELLSGAFSPLARDVVRQLTARVTPAVAAELNRIDGRNAMRPGDWRVILYCLGSARTLREAILRCADAFEAVDGRYGRMLLRVHSEIAELKLDSLRSHRSVAGCAIDLSGVAHFHGLLGWLLGLRMPAGQVAMNYDRSTFDALELPKFPVPLLLEAGWTGFSFPAGYLDHPVARSMDEVVDWSRHSFLFNLTELEAQSSVADSIRSIAMAALRDEARLPAFEQLVTRLASSPATLRRRLREAGTSYKRIKNSCRRELGLELLRRSSLSIEQVSARLDFCDSDAFRSAFRGWVGVSPSDYRRAVTCARRPSTHYNDIASANSCVLTGLAY